ncbi:response regulator [Roseovarius aestuarii]|uniref:Chemotaxis-specific methylesterase n=1 Tax=Roseovarius aestuarii TaxID=475083 RepID=A0A1X7BTZ2_9RHOB|nr:response regulator [Roseovarius aestuarii]SMC12980.1 chemotaxis-specific methylesterase [Roseovarius aestuarii]
MKGTDAKVSNMGLISALVIDDNAFDRRRLLRIAKETCLDFYLKEVSEVHEFGHILDQDKFDIIFVDLNLVDANGMNLLPVVRSHQVNKNAAMIMVAGDDQAEVALSALRAGFADYIEKSALSKASLERATINAIQKTRLAKVAVAAEAETKSIEAVLKSFSTACSEEMQPMLVRMVRQIRQLKSEIGQYVTSESISQIENTCARMDEFFQDLSSLADEGELSSIVASSLLGQPQALRTSVISQAGQRQVENGSCSKTIKPRRPSQNL